MHRAVCRRHLHYVALELLQLKAGFAAFQKRTHTDFFIGERLICAVAEHQLANPVLQRLQIPLDLTAGESQTEAAEDITFSADGTVAMDLTAYHIGRE